MRVLSIIFFALLTGGLVGGAVAYVQVHNDLDAVTDFPGETKLTEKASTEALPRAQVDEQHYNFGTMQRGTSKEHEFTIRNVGGAPLKLRAGTTSCKCTLSEVSEAPIAPGETTHVKLHWTAKSDNGPFRQSANIMTNDPLQSTLELTIDGKIMSASGVEPADLLFDKIPVGESKSAQVYVMAMLQDDLTVTDPLLSDPATRDRFDVKIEPVDPKDLPNKSAKQGVRVTVTAKPGLAIGRFQQWLSLRTNLQDAEKLEIPIAGQVVGDISVHGTGWSEERGALTIPSVKSSEGGHGRVSIVVRGADAADTTFKVKSVDPPELKVTVGEPKKLKDTLVQTPLDIEIPAGTRPMVRLYTAQGEPARIVLTTTHPKIKELSVEVLFSVER
ncbi:MAG TPA: DUF1573 domain-containing protein [Lacipirellulaceae bacterium]|nr:DUF1573 domain-containing protein [Lacipirellulaceae bacterium]